MSLSTNQDQLEAVGPPPWFLFNPDVPEHQVCSVEEQEESQQCDDGGDGSAASEGPGYEDQKVALHPLSAAVRRDKVKTRSPPITGLLVRFPSETE